MNTFLARLLLATTLSVFLVTPRATARDVNDPGKLHSANRAISVPGLRPCNDGAGQTLQIDPHQPFAILVHGHNGSPLSLFGLAEALASHGQQSVCFAYDGRDSLMVNSGKLANAVVMLAKHLKTPRITVIGHSIGGLVARKALISDREDAVRNVHIDLQLVTVSAPFSGIYSARTCEKPVLRAALFDIPGVACWLITGDNWHEITAVSDFIRKPGDLKPEVRRHLMVVTDERSSCRFRLITGRCIKNDYVFSLAEQLYPLVTQAPRTMIVKVSAGHGEIIGGDDVIPLKLIDVLERERIVRAAGQH